MPKFLKAYTTLEVLVVIGLIVLITGMVIPISLRQTKFNELSVAGKDLHSAIFTQQQKAFAGKNDSKQGVYIESEGYWLFEGEDFTNATAKDYFPFSKGIIATPEYTEIIFEESSQKLNEEKNMFLIYDGYNYVIQINKEGVINSYVQT